VLNINQVKKGVVFTFFWFLTFFVFPFYAVSKTLVFGMSTVLTGPNANLGKEFSFGVKAAFNQQNLLGGIRGQKLRLIVLDDGYDPARTIKNMYKLINEYRVLAVVGNVGTPTGVVALPIAVKNKVLFFGPFTGASALRPHPPNPYVYHYRASYYEEVKYLLTNLLKVTGIKPTDVAFFTQNDAYGDEIFSAGIRVLESLGLKRPYLILHVRYPRNTLYVHKAAATVLRVMPHPKVIVLGGTYSACARFIEILRKHGYEGYFVSVSFIGAESLARIAKKDPLAGDGVIVSEVVPPFSEKLPIVKQYLTAIKKLNPEAKPSFVSLEGYIVGKILIKALTRIKGKITRSSIVNAMAHLGEFDIGLGVPLRLDAKHHQASHHVWLVRIEDGKVVPFNFKELKTEKHETTSNF